MHSALIVKRLFFQFTHTEPLLISNILSPNRKKGDHKPEKTLMLNFSRYVARVSGLKSKSKDEQIKTKAGEANSPPLPSKMISHPLIKRPSYTAITGAPINFIMSPSNMI